MTDECPEKLKLALDIEKRFSSEREINRREITKLRDDNDSQHNRIWNSVNDMGDRMLNIERGIYYGPERMNPPRKRKKRKPPASGGDRTMIELPNPITRKPIRVHTDRYTAIIIIIILFILITLGSSGIAYAIMG